MAAPPELMPLAEAPRRVGEAVRFAAVVQQISAGKRALVAARQRVAVYNALLLADPSKQFFKLTCCGDALPTLPAADHAPQDATIRVGDIVLFSECVIKVFNGSAEAQFSPQTSRAQLLYRRDRYFNTRDVRLKDLYPMIEWYRQHRHEFMLTDRAVATAAAASAASSATRIKDLRENMVATVVCKLRRQRGAEGGGMSRYRGSAPASGFALTSTAANAATRANTELDGVLLSELVMLDAPNDSMIVNLWDQHAEKRAVARLLSHQGAFRIAGVVVGLHAMSNRLLANTTDQTTFQCLEASDPDAVALEQRLGGGSLTLPGSVQPPVSCATIDDLEASSCEDRHILHNVRVEQIHFDESVGSNGRILPRFARRLVEAFCSVCERPLLLEEHGPTPAGDGELEKDVSVGRCVNNCEPRGGSRQEPCIWRYRSFHMTLRDDRNQRVVVQVDDNALVELVGNIDAQTLMSSTSPSVTTKSARSAAVCMLSALVASGDQTFEAEISCVVVEPAMGSDLDSHSLPSSMALAYSGDRESQQLHCRRVYMLTALVPTTQHLLPF